MALDSCNYDAQAARTLLKSLEREASSQIQASQASPSPPPISPPPVHPSPVTVVSPKTSPGKKGWSALVR